jgi:hypothetical protein
MRALALICCSLLILVLSSTGQNAEPDPYCISIVKFELQMRSGGRYVIHSWSQKRLYRLGDGVSDALLKILEDSDLKNPQTVRDLLPIIRDAFTQPYLIAVEADKKPKVTTFLLDYLRQNVPDPQAQLDIQQTVEFVKSKTEE